MKYAQILLTQSHPKWAPYNVDYCELKNMIKANTTKKNRQAIAIPGQADILIEQFEKLFYEELSNQHDRVDLFVKSKVDEINCRLQITQRQLFKFTSRNAHKRDRRKTLSSRRREKLDRYHRQIESCGEDIKCLTKFISAQRIAFHKILKKYTKWTGSRALPELFYSDILGSPKSFIKRNFDPLIYVHTNILETLRNSIPELENVRSQESSHQETYQSSTKTRPEVRPGYSSYWNEYDDASQADDDPYLVYVNPDSGSFPGSSTLAYMFSKAKKPVEKVKEWLAPGSPPVDRRPLIEHMADTFCELESTVGTESDETYTSLSESPAGYSTFFTTTAFRIGDQSLSSSRESFLFHMIPVCYASSLTILLITWMLAVTGKKKLRTEVDAGVAIGIVTSLLFATTGFLSVHFRRKKFSWTYRCCSTASFLLTCSLNCMLIMLLLNKIITNNLPNPEKKPMGTK